MRKLRKYFETSQVLAQTPSKCGPFPTAKKPTECCENLDKLMKPQLYETCKAQCDQDHCCGATCISNALGFVKDKKFDKVTAKAAISKAFGGDSSWSTVKKQIYDFFRLILDKKN